MQGSGSDHGSGVPGSGAGDVVANLLHDHALILRATVAFERAAARLSAPGDPNAGEPDNLGFMLRFFREFADGIHHAKEESALMPALLKAGGDAHAHAVHDIMDQHIHGAQLLARLTAASKDELVGLVPDFCEFVQQHLRAEERALFPLVDELLDRPTRDHVLRSVWQIEDRAGGRGHYEGLEREIERLLLPMSEIYPERRKPW